MSTIEEALRTLITTTEPLATTLRVSGRSAYRYHPGKLPANADLPAIVYQRIDTRRVYSQSGYSGAAQPHFQLACWGASLDIAIALATQLRHVIDAYKGTVDGVVIGHILQINEFDLYDAETQTWRRITEWDVGHDEV